MSIPRWVWFVVGGLLVLYLWRALHPNLSGVAVLAGSPGGAELLMVGVAIFLLPAVVTGIRLQRVPFMMVEYVALALLVLLVVGIHNGGSSPLEKVDLCTPPSTAWPRAPQPTQNLAGCPNYNAPAPDPAHDIPVSPAPEPVEK